MRIFRNAKIRTFGVVEIQVKLDQRPFIHADKNTKR